MKRVLLTCVGVVALHGSAYAADIPRPPAIAKAPIYVPYNWTGAYAGLNAGWGWSNGSGNTVLNGVPGTASGSGNGFLGGVQVGYNVQTGSFVYGIETDFQFGAGSGNATGTNGAFVTTATARTNWFGTIRPRLGYAVDRWMVYATGGAVYGSSNLRGTIAPTGVSFNDTETFWTWTLGAGIEGAAWSGWTAKLEYLYFGTPNNVPTPPGMSSVEGTIRTHVVRLGVNTRF